MDNLYRSMALVSCFDGDLGGDPPAGDPPAGDPPANPPAGKVFTQDELNKILADDRRKHQAALTKTEQTYKELLANNQQLSAKDRQTLEENLATIQGQLRTKEQQAALDRKQLEEEFNGKLTQAEQRAQGWESRYKESTVTRSIQDAAVSAEAFNHNQIVALLRPMTKLVEDVDAKSGKSTGQYKVMVEFPDVDATTGEAIMTSRTPDEAVKRMKELPETYGNLFRHNVVSGIGSNSSTGLAPGANGKPDLKKLASNPEAFRKVLKESPEILGLRRHQ